MRMLYISVLLIGILVAIEGNHPLKRKGNFHETEKNDDPYFHNEKANDDQPEISEEDLPKNGEIFEGDIIMDNDIRRTVVGIDEKRSADILADVGKKKHWKEGIIPYVIDRKTVPIIKRQIHKAIRILNHYTCVRFIAKRRRDKDYVTFTSNAHGCSSSVGRVGGEQTIHLARGCSRIGTVLHEMMHAMGIMHEQSRPDRDKHIKVIFENIERSHALNFRKYQWYNTDILSVKYNFYSVMHYSNHAFTKNHRNTLISLLDKNLKFGQRKRLSKSDVRQINNLYQCNVDYNEDDLLDDMTDEVVMDTKEDREENGEEIERKEDEEARKFNEQFE